jgi:glycosyltransferase involved in cell wall biosynthesis
LRIAEAVEGPEFKNFAFCLESDTAVSGMFSRCGFRTARYRGEEPSYRHPRAFLTASRHLAKELRRNNIDLVHCSDLLAAYHGALGGKLARVPVVCQVRGRFSEIPQRFKPLLRLIDKFVFVSKETWTRFGLTVPKDRGAVIYDGIEITDHDCNGAKSYLEAEFGISATSKVVGMVARVAPSKDYQCLIKAAREVVRVEPNVHFMVVGEYSGVSSYRAHYELVQQILAENRVQSSFTFTDFRPDVGKLIDAMDIFVLSTHQEGLPLVILEAMARGKPVVATNIDGIPEVVIDGATGLLHDHENYQQLASQILKLVRDEQQAVALGQAGRQFVNSDFSRERFAANMKNLYREMVRA